jgi:hypothetical protein
MPHTGELVIDHKGNFDSSLLLQRIAEVPHVREKSSDNLLGFMFHV